MNNQVFVDGSMSYISAIQRWSAKFRELMNVETGTLKIGASTTVTQHVLLKYLDLFREKYPNVSQKYRFEEID